MNELFGFIWNILKIIVLGVYFIVAVGAMLKLYLKLIDFYKTHLSRLFLGRENSDSTRWLVLIISITLAFLSFILMTYIIAKVIGNGVLFLFFLAGLYFIFRYYQQSKENNKSM
ncbi:hypothetical protein MUA31_00485 [Staphylococcus simulans]|uniref:hypothetical protein n=1 Tax=Staphylococcus simulans TaxID=1286 RepID=UPI0021D07D8F|nr:hypothetical protein [Staphylococcus simulans]UXR35445.1 hypothetical protein MUA31_00485 [Staphylococcus simulans]